MVYRGNWACKMEEKQMKKKKILFICLGNICRSPAAHAVMQHLVDAAGKSDKVEIDSAGIGSWHVGELPDKRMRMHGSRRGYAVNHIARQFAPMHDFKYFDLIVGMDAENLKALNALVQSEEDKKKIVGLADYFTHHPDHHTVPDPYYGGSEGFELVLDLVEDGCSGLLTQLSLA